MEDHAFYQSRFQQETDGTFKLGEFKTSFKKRSLKKCCQGVGKQNQYCHIPELVWSKTWKHEEREWSMETGQDLPFV